MATPHQHAAAGSVAQKERCSGAPPGDRPMIDAVTTTDASPATLGGYRLVRSLGTGSRAEVLLGAGSTGTVALKVFKPEVPQEDVGRELEALGRLPEAHCVRLVDILSSEGGHPVLVLDRVPLGGLAQWLRDRGEIAPGEAVTVLAPLASTLGRLHRAGVAHGGLRAQNVHLGLAGEPVILGFGHTSLFEPGSSIAAIEERAHAVLDRQCLAALASLVLESVGGGAREYGDSRLLHLADWVRQPSVATSYEFTDELEQRLFDLAEPLPLALPGRAGVSTLDGAPRPEISPGGAPGGVAVFHRASGSLGTAVADRELLLRPRRARRGDEATSAWFGDLLESSPVALARSRIVPWLKTVRRPVWIVAGAVTIALIAALAFLPQGEDATHPAVAKREVTPPSHAPQPDQVPVLPDDPVAALPLLLDIRSRCFSERSVLCLDGVDDDSSGAFVADSGAVRQLQGGGEVKASATLDAPAPKLVESLGDSVLVQLDARLKRGTRNPASVLMIRTKAGWRIRSYVSGNEAPPS